MVEMASLDTSSKPFPKPHCICEHSESRILACSIHPKVLFQPDIRTTELTPLPVLSQRRKTCHFCHFYISNFKGHQDGGCHILDWQLWFVGGEFATLHEINNADFWTLPPTPPKNLLFKKLLRKWSCNLFSGLRNISLRKHAKRHLEKYWGVQSIKLVFWLSQGGD